MSSSQRILFGLAAGVAVGVFLGERRGRLRIGYLPRSLPFAFFNEGDDLVGYDVELAHHLADALDVELEFVPTSRDDLIADLEQGYCDIVMSGVPLTTDLASRTLMSTPYVDETLGFVVPDDMRDRFATWEGMRSCETCCTGSSEASA